MYGVTAAVTLYSIVELKYGETAQNVTEFKFDVFPYSRSIHVYRIYKAQCIVF